MIKRKHSELTKEKIRLGNIGRVFSDSHREKLRVAQTGKRHSELSKSKMRLNLIGNSRVKGKHWTWKKDKVKNRETLKYKLRNCKEMKEWRESVIYRDHSECQQCKTNKGTIQVDHIIPFWYILFKNRVSSFEDALNCKELWNTDNGRTLCLNCHRKTETFGLGSFIAFRKVNAIVTEVY